AQYKPTHGCFRLCCPSFKKILNGFLDASHFFIRSPYQLSHHLCLFFDQEGPSFTSLCALTLGSSSCGQAHKQKSFLSFLRRLCKNSMMDFSQSKIKSLI
ncbi:MAG: hypothetical protein AAGI90_07030, partial [Chlamydiota bacterium]